MVKIDLITGFLGSGKTTFIERYAEYLLKEGEKVGILENDYGAINVDMLLLAKLKEKGIGLEMVAGGCDYDCHIRRFKTKLITMAMLGYDRVIVEPSGIFDVDEFYDILSEDPLDQRYQIDNVITIMNANILEYTSSQEQYLLASQAATAGRIVLSHGDEYSKEVLNASVNLLNSLLEEIHCLRRFKLEDMIIGNLKELTDEDFEKVVHSGYQETGFVKKFSMDDSGFKSLFFMNVTTQKEELIEVIKKIFSHPEYGNVLRIKGFTQEENQWYQINATKDTMEIEKIPTGQQLVIVIGQDMKEKEISNLLQAQYSSAQVEADSKAAVGK